MPPFLINVDLHLCARRAAVRALEKIAVSGHKENVRRSIKLDFSAHVREFKYENYALVILLFFGAIT